MGLGLVVSPQPCRTPSKARLVSHSSLSDCHKYNIRERSKGDSGCEGKRMLFSEGRARSLLSLQLSFLTLLLQHSAWYVHAFAMLMTNDYYCSSLHMTVGTVIMGTPVEEDETRMIVISRAYDGELLNIDNSTSFLPGERLKVGLAPATTQMVFEVRSSYSCSQKAYFEDGLCEERTRTTEKNPYLIMPTEKTTDCSIQIWAGWATSFKSGVKISPQFIMNGQEDHVPIEVDPKSIRDDAVEL